MSEILAFLSSPLIIPLLGGGLMGSILTIIYQSLKNQVQSVGISQNVTPILKKFDSRSPIKISLNQGQESLSGMNLFHVEFDIKNSGNQDISNFDFGITTSKEDKIIHIENYTTDRHHVSQTDPIPSIKNPLNTIDFTLSPFNRKDNYNFSLYIITPTNKDMPNDIKFSSKHSIKFRKVPSLEEINKLLNEDTGYALFKFVLRRLRF